MSRNGSHTRWNRDTVRRAVITLTKVRGKPFDVQGQLTSFGSHLGSVPLAALTRFDDEEAGCLTKTLRHWHSATLVRAKMIFKGLGTHLLTYSRQTKCVD